MNRAALKKDAKKQLTGNWQWAVIFTLVTGIIDGLVSGLTTGIGAFLAAML